MASPFPPRYRFPNPRGADEDGVVAVGGPFNGKRLLAAYQQGIFPWSGDPIRWYSPEPRSIFWEVRLPSKLGKMVRRGGFTITYDRAFRAVITACAAIHRPEGEWITDAFVEAYTELHEMGYAHSVEVWQDGALAGGLYGVHVAGLYAGESMFYRAPNASKIAFAALCYHLEAIGVALFDCQVLNLNTLKLGAALVHRDDYLRMLKASLRLPVPFSGQRWPILGCGRLDGTSLKDALHPEHREALAASPCGPKGPNLPDGVTPLRFWGLER